MLAGQGYTQILEMIMKRLQPAFIQGSDYCVQNNGNSGLPTTDDEDTGKNPYDPKGINAFEDYDYHLEYNTEDELIWFTSHDGKIKYTLNKDSYEDLVTLSVHTERIDFKIALIYEFYDIRVDTVETDEKGKLTDVIIMTNDGKPFPLGLSIQPVKEVFAVNDTVEFRAIVQNVDGTTFEVTEQAGWASSNSAYDINKGVILNAVLGKSQISAIYDMCIAYADLEVVDFTLIVEPGSVIVDYDGNEETIPYRAYRLNHDNTRIDVTSECAWSVSNWIGSLVSGTYRVNASSIGNGTVTATFKDKTADAKIKSSAPEIVISPSSRTVNVGSSAAFKAFKISTGEEVTSLASWITDKYTIGNDGVVIDVNSAGTANITANYNGAIANATLQSVVPVPSQFPDDVSGSGKFYSKDYMCNNTGTIVINYDMYGYPDKLDVYSVNADGSTGANLATTGAPVSDSGTVTLNIQSGTKVRIIVSSDNDGTAWEYHATIA